MERTNELLCKKYKEEGCQTSLVELIQNNEGLVISCAKRWQFAYGAKNIEFEDLCSIGHEGLLEAVKTYDPDRATLFSTHATNRINVHMQQYLYRNARYISFPEEKLRMINRINRCRPEVESTDLYDWYEKFVEKEKERISFEKFKSLVQMEQILGVCGSLNELIGDEQKDELQDMLGIAESPEEAYMDTALKEELQKCLDILTDQERQVISLCFGLNRGTEMSQDQVAKMLGISKARVSDIKGKALYKLENSSKVKCLREFL